MKIRVSMEVGRGLVLPRQMSMCTCSLSGSDDSTDGWIPVQVSETEEGTGDAGCWLTQGLVSEGTGDGEREGTMMGCCSVMGDDLDEVWGIWEASHFAFNILPTPRLLWTPNMRTPHGYLMDTSWMPHAHLKMRYTHGV